jgi:hypothetical protein
MRKLGFVVLFAAWAARGAAQSSPASAPAEIVGPSCASPDPSLVDTLRLVLSLAGVAAVPGNRKNAALADLEAQAVAEAFQPPSTFRWPANWISTAPARRPGDSVAAGGLRGLLSLRVDRRGRLIDAAFPQPTDVGELNASLLAAARRADSAGALAPTLGHDSIASVLIRLDADTVPGSGAVPLTRLKLPYSRITTGASVSWQAPIWIPKSIDRSTDAIIELQYVIGEDGRVIPASLRLLRSKPTELGPPVAGAILMTEFHPARSGACPVKQLVHQRIGLRVNLTPGKGPATIQPLPDPPSANDSPPAFRLRQ